VIDKYLSVAGEVDKPLMFKVPIGTPVTEVLSQAGLRIADYALILGGPMMGLMMVDPQKIASAVVTKTLGSLIVLPAGHTMVQTWRMRQNVGRLRHQTQSACIQCRMCTDLCPRYLIGHQMRPHLVMRNFWREDTITDPAEYIRAFGDAVNCCDCGICEEFACPMGLSPRKVNDHFKQMIRQKGLTVPRNLQPVPALASNEGRTPTLRLVARLGLTAYEDACH
jgi:Na+-translocating ferredoxin:NAD+ oxidoreductase RnfC subunit